MRQLTLATGTFETHRRPTRRETFLSDREKVVPWQDLCAVIMPYHPKGENGRPRGGLSAYCASLSSSSCSISPIRGRKKFRRALEVERAGRDGAKTYSVWKGRVARYPKRVLIYPKWV